MMCKIKMVLKRMCGAKILSKYVLKKALRLFLQLVGVRLCFLKQVKMATLIHSMNMALQNTLQNKYSEIGTPQINQIDHF